MFCSYLLAAVIVVHELINSVITVALLDMVIILAVGSLA